MIIKMGQYDAPQIQAQPIFWVDNYKNNIAVFGGPMSGKTTFIKTLLVRLYQHRDQLPREDVYIIDFGGNLGEYGKLFNVCACFDSSNEENIKRVFKTIEKRLEQNAKQLGSDSFYSLYEKSPEKCPNHIMLIIENLNTFLSDERYAAYQDRLLHFCRDGLSKGLCVVFTANDVSGTGRLMANIGQKIAFDMPSDYYFELFGSKINKPMSIPGRGIANIDSANYEFQCFMPFENEDELYGLLDDKVNPNAMASFSELLTAENFAQFSADGTERSAEDVGLDYYEHRPVSVDLNENRAIAIYGKRRFGKTNLLSLLLQNARNRFENARYVYFDDGRKKLQPFFEEDIRCGRDAVYIKDSDAFRAYLGESGYGGMGPGGGSKPVLDTTPFTVFVIRSKVAYQINNLIGLKIPEMIGNAETRNYLFLFADVRNITDVNARSSFNHSISLAFLLDNIGEFVADKGSKSVFAEMDAKELKSEYARCSVGDGYIYDIESDELQKLKFIKNID